MCALIKDFAKIQNILADTNLLDFVLKLILERVTLFEAHPYDRKVNLSLRISEIICP